MHVNRRTLVFVLVILACSLTARAGQSSSVSTPPLLTPEQMETFLLNANIVSMRAAGDGITNSRRATFSDGTLTHDAHIQTIDQWRAIVQTPKFTEFNFKDSYRYNIAGYRLARLLGMENVPVSVERRIQGRPAAVTWWIDDVMMDERARVKQEDLGPDPSRFAMQVHIQRVFDELIQNRDRNLGNIVWTKDWKMWLIDHTRAFRLGNDLLKPELLQRCDRALLAAMRGLTTESVKKAVGDSLTAFEIDSLIDRAKTIAEHFDRRSAELGESRVMFTFTR